MVILDQWMMTFHFENFMTNEKRVISQNQPKNVCFECGKYWGAKLSIGNLSNIQMGVCNVCNEFGSVTTPFDFGYLKDGWDK